MKKISDLKKILLVDYGNMGSGYLQDLTKLEDSVNMELSTLQKSYYHHLDIFRIFSKHIQKVKKEKIMLCHIT